MSMCIISHMKQTKRKLTEAFIAVSMSAEELKALNAYCAKQRRKTGDTVPRAAVVRLAIKKLLEGDVS